jgi:hypothetical protein
MVRPYRASAISQRNSLIKLDAAFAGLFRNRLRRHHGKLDLLAGCCQSCDRPPAIAGRGPADRGLQGLGRR